MRRYLLAGALLAIFFVFFVSAAEKAAEQRAAHSAVYAEYLRAGNVREHVSVRGIAYEVVLGEVLGTDGSVRPGDVFAARTLAYAKSATRRSPLFALPGVEPDALLNATDLLERAAEGVAKRQKTRKAAGAVRQDLYPLSFLRAAARTERARLDFLASGSEDDLRRYESTLSSALAAYRSDLARFTRSFEAFVPADIGSYATDAYLVSRKNILNAADIFSSRVQTLEKEAHERTRCFAGNVRFCKPDGVFLPDVQAAEPTQAGGFEHAQSSRALLADSGMPLLSGRLVVLSESACVEKRPGVGFFFVHERVRVAGITYEPPFFVGDAVFMDNERVGDMPFYAYFAEHGVRYIPIRSVAYYACPVADADIAAVRTTERAAEFAQSHPLSAYDPLLSVLERRLESENLLREEDALTYLHAGRTLAQRGALETDVEYALTDILLEHSTGSGGLYNAVLDIASGEATEVSIADKGVGTDFDALYRFYLRSGFASLFGSSVLSGRDRAGLFARSVLAPEEEPFAYYSDLANSREAAAALAHDIAFYVQVHTIDP